MKQRVSLREANQHLSRYVEAVERGAEVVITRRGKAVAVLCAVPNVRSVSARQRAAWRRIKSSARKLGIGKISRDEAHER